MLDQQSCRVNAQTNADVRRFNNHPTIWLVEGMIAVKAVTLLSAPEKTGKTTFLSVLLDRRCQGGQLLGRAVDPGTTVVCSEEDSSLWAARQPPFDFGQAVEFCTPHFPVTSRRWRRFISHVYGRVMEGVELVVIDTIMNFLPAGENNPQSLRSALRELRLLTEQAAVLLFHQTYSVRHRHRTSGPLAAFADILIDMHLPQGDRFSRRRTFTGIGRYPGTLNSAAAELNPEGTDYILIPDALDVALPTSPEMQGNALPTSPQALVAGLPTPSIRDTLAQVISASADPLSRLEILARWPAGLTPPHRDSLTRCLTRACDLRLLTRTGQGSKSNPFRYALAKNEQHA